MRSTSHLLGIALWLCLVCAHAANAQQKAGTAQPKGGQRTAGSPWSEIPREQASRKPAPDRNAKTPVPEMSVTTHLDKTAVWVGDQFHYQIFVDHSSKTQFILENTTKETLNLDPLRVVNVASSTIPLRNGNERVFVDLTLASFATGVTELQIPQLTLFYFRKEGAAAVSSEGAAAESLTIQGPVIGLRSTQVPKPVLRDGVTVGGWPRSRWIVAGLGWGALVLLIGGGAWEGARLIRGRRARQGPDPRQKMAAIRDRWSQSLPADFDDADMVMEFYGRSYHDLKEYLGYLLDTHIEGLMADEMRAEMTRLAANPDLTDRVGKVLDICETARYARNPADLNSNAARGVADNMKEIFQVGSRM